MKEKLIYVINRKKYLLVELPLSDGSATEELMSDMFKRYGGLYQGIKEVKRGLFSWYAIVKFLIPFNKLDEFNRGDD